MRSEKHQVSWLGRRTDVANLIGRADLLIHPANQEPLGRVLLESAACGTPFVATDVGGTREIVAGLDVEILVPPKSPGKMAEAALRLLNDAELAAEVGERLAQIAHERFSVTSCADALTQLYQSLSE